MESQAQVQKAIIELDSPNLQVEQWVLPDNLKQERERAKQESTQKLLGEMMRNIQNPERVSGAGAPGAQPRADMPRPAGPPAAQPGPHPHIPYSREEF